MSPHSRRTALRAAAAAAAAVALAAPRAHAQVAAVNPFSFGVSGGASIPTGDFSDGFGTGFNVGVLVGVRVPTLPVSFRFEGDFHQFGLKDADDLRDLGISGDIRTRIISGTANALYTFSAGPTAVVRPYLIGGAGVYNLRVSGTGDVGDFLDEVIGSREETTTRLGLNGGIGLELPLSGINVFGEARVHTIFTRDARTTIVPIKVGLRF